MEVMVVVVPTVLEIPVAVVEMPPLITTVVFGLTARNDVNGTSGMLLPRPPPPQPATSKTIKPAVRRLILPMRAPPELLSSLCGDAITVGKWCVALASRFFT